MAASASVGYATKELGADMQCVLDLVHLSRQTLGDRGLETELLGLFDHQAGCALARLAGAAGHRTGGVNGADIAHMLKGSARAVGAFAVAHAASDVEQAMRGGASAERALQDLTQAVADARQAVASLLG